MKKRITLLAILASVVTTVPVEAADYFVSLDGRDRNSGRNRTAAFRSIQKGVDALKPGDTLTIAPGEYFGNVKRVDIGNMLADTVIRAEVPGKVVLRGDIPAPEFKKVEGYRFVYGAKFDKKPYAVMEHTSLHTFFPRASVAELEFNPGFYHYDASKKMLYISNPDLTPPDRHRYTVAVSGTSGLLLHNPKRVIIDGIAATGFHPEWGILLGNPVSCTVRNCECFMNVGGIVLSPIKGVGNGNGGSDNVVENCVAYGNSFGGIVRYGANNDVIRNCHTYRNVREDQEHFGIMHYSGMTGPLIIKNNISWGHNFNFSVKQGNQQERLENCVALGFIRIATGKMSHNLISGNNEYDRGSRNAPADTISFLREEDVDQDFEFADSLNLDFRLQGDSRFRGTAPDGTDRGPYPYKANIFYVSPNGNDRSDGLSMRKPWRTLKRAVKNLRSGDTVYLTEGTYAAAPLASAGESESPVRILGRGRGTVVIKGKLKVTGGAGVELERLCFPDGVEVKSSDNARFNNCTFFGSGGGLSVSSSSGLTVTHCVFAGTALSLSETRGVILTGNICANEGQAAVLADSAGAIRYSDYNNYADKTRCWKVGGAVRSLADLQKQHDRYSQTIAPKFVTTKGVPHLSNDSEFATLGANDTSIGIYHVYQTPKKATTIVGPFVHRTSDTTADIEWWATGKAAYDLAWGDTPEMKNRIGRLSRHTRFNSYSLTGLKPGKKYYFKILKASSFYGSGPEFSMVPDGAEVSFTTTRQPTQGRQYYVAPNGDDTNSGLSRKQALRTVSRAATKVGPGDTVLIAGGEYNETVRIRSAGTEDRPITFRCIEGEKVVFLGHDIDRSFELQVKPDNHFDGLYFRKWNFFGSGFVAHRSPRLWVTRCFNAMVSASNCPGTVIRNCVMQGGWQTLSLGESHDSVVENNVFVSAILRAVSTHSRVSLRGNVFGECIRNKGHQTLLELSDVVKESDNCFYLRWPEGEKLAVNNMPLPQYRAKSGSNSFAGNPMMPGCKGFRQGWMQCSDKDFDQYFSTNPKLILRDIGLRPDAFKDFKFDIRKWPYNKAWAQKYDKAAKKASALMKAGNNKSALKAYQNILKRLPLADRLKSDVLEKASLCAERVKDYDRAMRFAKEIPLETLSMHRQMQLLLARQQYSEIISSFSETKLGGRSFHLSFTYPELEDVMADLYYYRSLAYVHTGNRAAAEADLKIMNDKASKLSYTSGEAIHDLAALRLGDFYRTRLKNNKLALAEYLKVCNPTAWNAYPGIPKLTLTGNTETLAKATEAACDILRKQGKTDEVKKLQASLAKAQAAASELIKKDVRSND